MVKVRVNKRTTLGGQYLVVAAVGASTGHYNLLGLVLTAVGTFLVIAPAFAGRRGAIPFGFLLQAE